MGNCHVPVAEHSGHSLTGMSGEWIQNFIRIGARGQKQNPLYKHRQWTNFGGSLAKQCTNFWGLLIVLHKMIEKLVKYPNENTALLWCNAVKTAEVLHWGFFLIFSLS